VAERLIFQAEMGKDKYRISGKDLGVLAQPGFCPRCFWIQRRAPSGLPYQIFPGIFSSIDSYTKKVVHSWFDRHKNPPSWLQSLGDIVGYVDPPSYHTFNFVDEPTGMTLSGAPDAIFTFRDKTLLIGDYKTAKFTKAQDSMFPVYETQLNAYALIAERTGFGKVSKLALIYTEPVTDEKTADTDDVNSAEGFQMGFSAHILAVKLNTASIPPLLKKARKILELDMVPKGLTGCKDCERLEGIVKILK